MLANDMTGKCVLKCHLENANYRAKATTEQSVYEENIVTTDKT